MNRRDFLAASAALSAGPLLAKPAAPKGKAEHCIFLWLGVGMGQVDTFDPKAKSDPKGRKAGSAYSSIDSAVKGVHVCEHLSRTAEVLDRATIVRTVNHRVIDGHAFATNPVHTGRTVSGNVTYPSLGSLIVHAGGGLKHRGAFGATDEPGKKAIESPVSIPDFHATIHAALGIDPAEEVFDASRPVPITDGGTPIAKLFA